MHDLMRGKLSVLTIVALTFALSGCIFGVRRSFHRVVDEQRVVDGRVLFAMWPVGLGVFNNTDQSLTLDDRKLETTDAGGGWSLCVSEPQWRDDGWGITLSPHAAILIEACASADAARYGDLLTYQDGLYQQPLPSSSQTVWTDPARYRFAVPQSGGCLISRTLANGNEGRAVFWGGIASVFLSAGQELRTVGCVLEQRPASRPIVAQFGPGTWRVGDDIAAGRYDSPDPDLECSVSVQRPDVFGKVLDEDLGYSLEVQVSSGETITTTCGWQPVPESSGPSDENP